jgi:hypothetical protein
MIECCGNCQCLLLAPACAEEFGLCRRYPPQVFYVGKRNGGLLEYVERLPRVDAGEWCGEYRKCNTNSGASGGAPESEPTDK